MDKFFYAHRVRTASLDALVLASGADDNEAPRVSTSSRRIITTSAKDARKWRSIKRRTETTNTLPKAPDAWAPCRGQILDGVMRRMDIAGLDISKIHPENFEFCLPNEHSTQAQLAVFDKLFLTPMLVTDDEMASVISLELSTAQSPFLPPGVHFYVRSWTVTPEELRSIIVEMGTGDMAFEEVFEWKKTIDVFAPTENSKLDIEAPSGVDFETYGGMPETLTADPGRFGPGELRELQAKTRPKTFTIRYVGKVEGPRRPIDRFQQDLASRTSGVLHEFTQVLERLFPLVYDNGKSFLMKDASLLLGPTDPHDFHRHNADKREQFLIESLDHNTLLNRQRGGRLTDYVPDGDDVSTYASLGVNVYDKLLANAGTLDAETQTELSDHFANMQSFANNNSGTTGTSRHLFSDELRTSTLQQSMPYVYRNEVTLLVLVGKDITLYDYSRGKKFFDCGSQAATLVHNFFYRLISTGSTGTVATVFDSRAFPFVNLWNWLWHHDFAEVMKQLRLYFNIVRPLISATFSSNVNEVMRANFSGLYSSPRSITSTAGLPSVQFYDEDDKANSAFLNVPLIHPGRDKYTDHNTALRRMLDLSFQATLLLQQTASDVVDGYLDASPPEALPERQVLCERILEQYSTADQHQIFFKSLESARKELALYWSKTLGRNRTSKSSLPTEPVEAVSSRKPKLSTGRVQSVMSAEGRYKLTSLGRAEGEPNSTQRDRQLDHFWNLERPELHTQILHEESAKESWKAQFAELQPGQYFYLKVLSQMPAAEFVQNILTHVRPDLGEDPFWMTETPERATAVLSCGLWFHQHSKDPETGDIKPLHLISYPDRFLTAYDMQGSPIGISPNGDVTLRWKTDQNNNRSIILRAKFLPAVPGPGEVNAVRCIVFTEHGIDVVDGDGDAFRSEKAQNSGIFFDATVPLFRLGSTAYASDLWQSVRQAHGHEVPKVSLQARRFDPNPGVALVSLKQGPNAIPQNQPPLPQDANYLLEAFLQGRYPGPNGGTFHTADPVRAGEHRSTGDMQAFHAFLETPEWRGHPWAEKWRSFGFHENSKNAAILGVNLPVLRSCKTSTKQFRIGKNSAGKRLQALVYEIGGPGSALPFQAGQKGGKRKAADPELDDDNFGEGGSGSIAAPSAKRYRTRGAVKEANEQERG